MATLRDIRNRIKAVKNTRQITKAMKMVAASKLRKAQSRMVEMRPYADKMSSLISNLSTAGTSENHPLLVVRPRKTVEVIVVTSDRGLCGAFNSNILKTATIFIADLRKQGFDLSLSVVGKKAVDYFKRRDFKFRKTWTGLSGNIRFSSAQGIANDIIDGYLNESFDEVYIIYNKFKTVVTQIVTTSKLLPLQPIEESEGSQFTDFICEPTTDEIFATLLPKNIEVQIYRALIESQASEEGARMAAMENATKSADDMIKSLSLSANKARQATITNELMDIVGGVEALK